MLFSTKIGWEATALPPSFSSDADTVPELPAGTIML